MAPPRAYRSTDLEALLSPALGAAKAHEAVSAAIRAAGVTNETFDAVSARRILERIAREDGLLGVTGRVALSRLEGSRPSSANPRATKKRQSLGFVSGLLAATLGDERAGTLVREHARSLAFGEDIDLDQALALLEEIAKVPGVTGIAARFAKTRIHLSW